MHENKITRKIKKGASVKLILSLPLLIAAALLIYLLNISGLLSLKGYFEHYDVNSLSAIDDIAKRPLGLETYNVSLTAPFSEMVDTDIQKTEDDTPVGNYLAVYLDNKYVFCYLSKEKYDALTGDGSYTFTGSLRKVDPDVISLAVQDMAAQNISESEAKDLLYGYYIDTTVGGAFLRTFLYIATLCLLVWGLFVLIRSVMTLANVKNYPRVRKLSAYGEADTLFEEIEREYAQSGEGEYRLGRGRSAVCLTDKWIVVLGSLNVNFMRAEDLLWAYKLKQTTKAYGVVTTGVNYFLKLRSKAKTLSVNGLEQAVDSLLMAIAEKCPHAVVGYSARLEALWNSNKEQFAAYAEELRSGEQTSGIMPDSEQTRTDVRI